jgi:Anti-sigma-K factor rskA, C-terminal
VQQPATDVDIRLSELQTQIDRLSHALTQVRDAQDHTPPAEALAQLTERCAAILDQWTVTDERHQQAVVELETRLNNWNALEGRLQHESRQRMIELEQTIEHEWQALRQTHEEPVKQLREQAATLGETCVAAANLALRGFERAEARLAALEADLQGRMTQLSREVQLAVAEMHGVPGARRPALNGAVSPFPLESVMRIQEELRASNDNGHEPASLEGTVQSLSPARREPLAIDASTETVERLNAASRADRREAAAASARADRTWRATIAIVAVAVVGAAAFAVRLEQVASQLTDATTRATAAERQVALASDAASRQMAETKTDAERQVAAAHKAAEQAQIVSSVMASPDLVRFALTGTDPGARAYAQVLLSRTRGLVLSVARLPAARPGSTYQIWLLTGGAPVNVGVFDPDAAGRATIAQDVPPNVTRPVTGVAITLEPSGGRPSPTGPTVLARAQ